MYAENSAISIDGAGPNNNTKLGTVPKPSDTILFAEQDTTTATAMAESVTNGKYCAHRHANGRPAACLCWWMAAPGRCSNQ